MTSAGRAENLMREGTRQTLAARVRAARAHADIDQATLGEALGKSVYTVKRLERGQRDISDDELEVIAQVCQVPYVFLISGFVDEPIDVDQFAPLTIGTAEHLFAQLSARIDELETTLRERTPEELAAQVVRRLNLPTDD